MRKLRREEGKRLCPGPHMAYEEPFYCSSRWIFVLPTVPSLSVGPRPQLLLIVPPTGSHRLLLSPMPACGPVSFPVSAGALTGRTVFNTLTKEGRSLDSGIPQSNFQQNGGSLAPDTLFELPTRSHSPPFPSLAVGEAHQAFPLWRPPTWGWRV
jgi:hypothetical protein